VALSTASAGANWGRPAEAVAPVPSEKPSSTATSSLTCCGWNTEPVGDRQVAPPSSETTRKMSVLSPGVAGLRS
jgi:hypothetical protein